MFLFNIVLIEDTHGYSHKVKIEESLVINQKIVLPQEIFLNHTRKYSHNKCKRYTLTEITLPYNQLIHQPVYCKSLQYTQKAKLSVKYQVALFILSLFPSLDRKWLSKIILTEYSNLSLIFISWHPDFEYIFNSSQFL